MSTPPLLWGSILSLFLLRIVMSCVMQRSIDVPDEWWQATEVAYQQVFSKGHIPWEWAAALRSYLYPLIFDVAFRCLRMLALDSSFTVWLVPKVIASAVCVGLDIQVYRIGLQFDRLLFPGSASRRVATTALMFSVCHWFTGHIGVRTQGNVLEALLVLTAILEDRSFIRFLFFAGFGCALRITAAAPLIPFAVGFVARGFSAGGAKRIAVMAAQAVALISLWIFVIAVVDYTYYGRWTLTPLNFILFNVVEGHSAIFGTHPWHWYFTFATPVMCTPYVVLLAAYCAPRMWAAAPLRPTAVRRKIAMYVTSIVFTGGMYSFLPHKEMRFVFPVVPLLTVLAAIVWVLYDVHLTSLKKHGSLAEARGVLGVTMFAVNLVLYVTLASLYRVGPIGAAEEVRSGSLGHIHRLDVLAGCYSTPGHSYFHGVVDSLRTMDCTPLVDSNNVVRPTERDLFKEDPLAFVQWVYKRTRLGTDSFHRRLESIFHSPERSGHWELPDVLIAYSHTIEAIRRDFLEPNGYVRHKTLYHTFFVAFDEEDRTIEIWTRA